MDYVCQRLELAGEPDASTQANGKSMQEGESGATPDAYVGAATQGGPASADSSGEPDLPATTRAEPPGDEAMLHVTVDGAADDEDEGDDGDEFSAEGGASHELVAAPRDIDG